MGSFVCVSSICDNVFPNENNDRIFVVTSNGMRLIEKLIVRETVHKYNFGELNIAVPTSQHIPPLRKNK